MDQDDPLFCQYHAGLEAMKFLLDILIPVLNYLGDVCTDTARALVRLDPLLMIVLLATGLVWIGFACWGASIAEKGRRNPKANFFLGLLIPVVYPFIVMTLKPKRIKGVVEGPSEEPEAEPEAGAETEGTAAEAPAEEAPTDEPPAEKPAFGQGYFKELSENRDAAGWRIRYAGNDVLATRIVNALPKVAVVEMRDMQGGTQTIRIPYNKIESCTEI